MDSSVLIQMVTTKAGRAHVGAAGERKLRLRGRRATVASAEGGPHHHWGEACVGRVHPVEGGRCLCAGGSNATRHLTGEALEEEVPCACCMRALT